MYIFEKSSSFIVFYCIDRCLSKFDLFHRLFQLNFLHPISIFYCFSCWKCVERIWKVNGEKSLLVYEIIGRIMLLHQNENKKKSYFSKSNNCFQVNWRQNRHWNNVGNIRLKWISRILNNFPWINNTGYTRNQ